MSSITTDEGTKAANKVDGEGCNIDMEGVDSLSRRW